jgi:iron complex transport system permease protein
MIAKYQRTPFLIAILSVLSVLTLVFAPLIGMRFIWPSEIIGSDFSSHIFFTLRLPRVITGFVAGSGLAICGMVFQAMFRNPLATPYTLGVSSGASFGAALTILLGLSGSLLGIPVITLGAFFGAVAAMVLVFGFSSLQRTISGLTMLLAGVAVSFLFSSLLMFVQYLSNLRNSFQIIRWLMGGLEIFGYKPFFSMLPFAAIGTILIGWKLPELNHLLTGEDLAKSRGVDVQQTKVVLFFATSILVSAIVAVCGPIGFVGMMSPHICRMIIGSDHRKLGLATFLFGGIFLVLCDTISRIVIAPSEMPVGIITALLGGPFFLWILFRHVKKNEGNIW